MTRKHFEAIAHACRVTRPNLMLQQIEMTQWEFTVTAIASELESTNSRFDRERFLKACGYRCE